MQKVTVPCACFFGVGSPDIIPYTAYWNEELIMQTDDQCWEFGSGIRTYILLEAIEMHEIID